MKKRLAQWIFAFIGLPFMLQAQQPAKKSSCGCRFSSINQVGLLEGTGHYSLQLQSINGLRYRTWFAGVGIGLDHYNLRTAPLFFDIRKDLVKKTSAPFIYGDVGINLPWVQDKNKDWFGSADYNHGLYYDAGAGYSVAFGKNRALLFSGGVSLKKIRETRNYQVVCVMFPCPEQSEQYNYSFRRFSLKAGLRL